MNLENLAHLDFPFNHWVFSNCLEEGALDEISFSNIPSGDRRYDGTRAADHTGQGVDGKLRLFITKNNCQSFPYLTTASFTSFISFSHSGKLTAQP